MQLFKVLILTGSVLIGLGLLLWLGMKLGVNPRLGKLPGDIRMEGKNFSFYFPLSTSLLLSIILSLAFYLWGKWKS
jgi:hypothetical protein